MPLLSRKRTILAKIETVYGTDPTPTGAANAILVSNLNVTPLEADYAQRDFIRPYLGNSQELPAAARAIAEFEVEMAGAGAAGTAPGYGPLLRACGLSETTNAGVSVVYAPVSASFESVTIYLNVDGVLHKMTGARGTVSIDMPLKGIPKYKFKFTGLYNAVADAAAPTPTYTAFKQPLPVANGNTTNFALHSYAANMSSLALDLGLNVVHHAVVGSESVLITDRKAVGKIEIEATTVAAKDWFAAVRASTLGALTLTHGTTAGNKVKLDAPAVALARPSYTDMNSVQMLSFDMTLNPSSGNDEFTITVL